MELLEKITLYDILGYTLPGGIVLYVVGNYNMTQSLSVFGIICFMTFSFIIGILISQISSMIAKCFTKNICDLNEAKVTDRLVSKALFNAKILENDAVLDETALKEYFVNMYSDIQTDKNYIRIHNYASAALLYKNMCIVSFVCGGYYIVSKCSWEIVISFVAMVLFAYRWYQFEKKKRGYTLNWYVNKYVTNEKMWEE